MKPTLTKNPREARQITSRLISRRQLSQQELRAQDGVELLKIQQGIAMRYLFSKDATITRARCDLNQVEIHTKAKGWQFAGKLDDILIRADADGFTKAAKGKAS